MNRRGYNIGYYSSQRAVGKCMSILTGKDDLALAQYAGKIVSFIRDGAYIRLNDVADVTGKRLDNWMRLESTKELIAAFKDEPVYRWKEPIIVVKGNFSSENSDTSDVRYHLETLGAQGTWAHPDIAIEFARSANPKFALWCNRQIRTLLTTGEVHLNHQEWSREEYLAGVERNREDIRQLYGK